MSKGVNKVIIVGNVGSDPESRSFPDGSQVTHVSVATSEEWSDRQTGQKQSRTEWHKIVLRDRGNYRLGQIAATYLRKGAKIYVEGSLRTRKYQAQDGSDRYVTEIIAEQMQMLDSKDSRAENSNSAQYQGSTGDGYRTGGYSNVPPPMQQPAQQRQLAPAQGDMMAGANYPEFDDDIPF